MEAAVELPQYRSHKIVRAAKITGFRGNGIGNAPDILLGDIGGIVTLLPEWHAKHQPHVGGYYVLYGDGYASFSPAKAFEEGYAKDTGARWVLDHVVEAKITGTRQLSDAEVALMNEGKALAEQCGAYIAKLRKHPGATANQAPTEGNALPPLDQRWVSIGATDIQTGFMAVIRGIAQPTTF